MSCMHDLEGIFATRIYDLLCSGSVFRAAPESERAERVNGFLNFPPNR